MSTMSTTAEFDTYTPHPRYECTRSGVYHIGIKTDKEGNTNETTPVWLSDPIRLIGRGTDGTGSHYRIIEWKDRLTGAAKQAAVPSAEIGSVQGWQRLQSYGLTILSGRAKRERLADYLQTEGENTHYAVTARAGWHGTAYILPSGEVICPDNAEAGRVIYNGDKSQAPAYETAGTAQEWNAEIGQYLTGNSRLCLAVGTALAAPLIGLPNMEAGGFHLFGDSRDGKSIAARIALSIWGNPAALMQTWTGTAHGFTNLANARNDGLLVLDEIGQANARQVSQTAYSVINGVSKVQGAKEGGNRESTRWKTLLFSTGEKPLDAFIRRNGEDWNAGQAARLPSIPSNAGQGLGIYDRLHGFPNGAALSEHLTAAAAEQHGTIGRAFIAALQNNPATLQTAKERQNAFMQTLPELNGQARTVALRFALAAAALETAALHGLITIPAGAAMTAVRLCFDSWHGRAGSGKYEDQAIIGQAEAFMSIHAHSMRFSDWDTHYTNHNHAGYRKQAGGDVEYWINPPTFEIEICGSYDKAKVCEVLHAVGWLLKAENGRWQHQRKRNGTKSRYYVLINEAPPETEE